MIVYEITCTVDGRRYIGSTKHPLEKRWGGHITLAATGSTAPLYVAMREHGTARFIMREVACARTMPDLRELERALMQQEGTAWPAGFNACHASGIRQSPAWRKRRALVRKLKPDPPHRPVVTHTAHKAELSCGHMRYRRPDERHWPPETVACCECMWDTNRAWRKRAASAMQAPTRGGPKTRLVVQYRSGCGIYRHHG